MENEEFVEKDDFIKKIEKKEKGVIKIDFNEEKEPIQIPKNPKKVAVKPQEQEINEEKSPETDLNQLEQEIKEKRKLLKKIKKEKEEKAKIEKQKEEERQRIKQLEEEQQKLQKEQEEKMKTISEIPLNPNTPELIKICPICSSKIKKKKVKKEGLILKQTLKCKNKKCNFIKEIVMNI